MKVSLAKYDNGTLVNNWNNYNFVLNMDDYLPPKLKNDLPKKTVTVNGQPEEKVVVNGHFWLRDVDDSSIGAKVNGHYKYVLNREAETDGLNYWTDEVKKNDNGKNPATYERKPQE